MSDCSPTTTFILGALCVIGIGVVYAAFKCHNLGFFTFCT